MKITLVTAEEIRDSRGNPTVRAIVLCEDGSTGSFAVPSGASTGTAEAVELRDSAERGAHVSLAIERITTEMNAALAGIEVTDQGKIDALLLELDGTENKSRLGGNSMIGVSVAACRAAAASRGVELYAYLRTLADIAPSHETAPFLYMNLINGGAHAATRLAFQEYMIVPQTESPREALALGTEVLRRLEEYSAAQYSPAARTIGDEGGIALDVEDIETPLKILDEIRGTLPKQGSFRIALDIAASSFFKDGSYRIGEHALSSEELGGRLAAYAAAYDLLSIEDPFEENDFASFAKLQTALPATKIVGDDLTTTNARRVQKAIDERSIEAVIIKPNQIGTVSETLETMALARKHAIDCIVSHRSGETMDAFIADLAFAFKTFGIKAGAPRAKERMAKITRLIELADLYTV